MNQQLLRVLIADDEPLARCLVQEFLRHHPDAHVVGEAENGAEAVQAIESLQPDLVFLDIQMPVLNGLDVLECTGRRHGVIFTTAYEQHALQAFELHAVDYLLKPFSQARFDTALDKARLALRAAADPAPVSALVREQAVQRGSVIVRDRRHIHVLALAQIEYVQAQDDYVSIHCAGRDYLKTQTLAELELQIGHPRFVRVHRSYLLNVDHLQALERPAKDTLLARLRSGQSVPVSRSGHERLLQLLPPLR